MSLRGLLLREFKGSLEAGGEFVGASFLGVVVVLWGEGVIMMVFFDGEGGVGFEGVGFGVEDEEFFDDLKIVGVDFVVKDLLITLFLKHQKIKL